MSKYIGRLIKLGIGKETVRGTAAAATYWLPVMKVDHADKAEYAVNEAGFGTIVDSVGGEVTKNWGEGGFSALLGDKHFGLILYALFGTLQSAAKSAPNADVYDHTVTLAENAQHQSLTIGVDESNGDYQFPLGMLNSLELKFELAKLLEYTATFKSKKGTSASLTPALPAENIFRPQDFHFYIAANLAGLDAASEIPVKSCSLKIEKDVEDYDVLGSTEPSDILNKSVKITGSVTLIWDAETYKNYYLQGTTKAVRIKLTDTGVTIGSALNPELKIDLAKVIFNDFSKDTALNNIVMQTLSFKAVYSTSDSKVGEAVLTNLVTSY